MNAALNLICSCRYWHGHMLEKVDPLCCIHGADAGTAERRKVTREREGAALAVQEHRMEALTWIRRYRASKARLIELNKKLKELGCSP